MDHKKERNKLAVGAYRARQLGKPATLTYDEWLAILSARPECSYCGGLPFELEHIVPLSHPDSPGHVSSNVTVACTRCNRKKGSQSWSIPTRQLKLWG